MNDAVGVAEDTGWNVGGRDGVLAYICHAFSEHARSDLRPVGHSDPPDKRSACAL